MSIKCSLGHENPDGSAFCDECGEPLGGAVATAASPDASVQASGTTAGEQICASCGTANPAGEAFCSNCGAPLLASQVAQPAPTPAAAPAPVAAAVDQSQAPQVSQAPVAAVAGGVARLIVEADNQEFDISGKDTITIGREDAVSNIYPDVDLTPHGGEEGGVSRMHARMFVDNGEYMIEDENSTNFTYVNRQRLTAKTPTPVHDNDEIRLGRVLLRFKTA
jgi:hypothetical protein